METKFDNNENIHLKLDQICRVLKKYELSVEEFKKKAKINSYRNEPFLKDAEWD